MPTANEWAKQIGRCNKSGQSAEDYGAHHELKASTLCWRRSELRRRERDKSHHALRKRALSWRRPSGFDDAGDDPPDEVGCWSHTRRKFSKAATVSKEPVA